MQQTQLDHFLKERFVYVYEIKVNRLPRRLPWGVSVAPLPRSLRRSWNFLLRCDSNEIYHSTIARLRGERMMYDAGIGENAGVVAKICNPPNQGSFTYNSIWSSIKLSSGFFLLNTGIRLSSILNIGGLFSAARIAFRD